MLGTALNIHEWLAADQDTPHVERVARDREIGQAASASSAQDRVLAWWGEIASAEDRAVSERFERRRGLLTAVIVVVGLVLGGGASAAAFGFDRGAPINLLVVLGIFVLLPGLLLALSLLALVLRGAGGRLLADSLSVVSVGRWVGGWMLPKRSGGWHAGSRSAAGALASWQFVLLSQWFAVAFYAGLMTVYLIRVAATDLAFGWSSTLQLDSATVAHWFQGLAWPWSSWWAAATPEAAWVEGTRFYRLETGATQADAQMMALWWPYVLACIVFWGLLPRLAVLICAAWRLRTAEARYLVEHPDVAALLDRLMAPEIRFGERSDEAEPEAAGSAPALALPQGADVMWLGWNNALTHAAPAFVAPPSDAAQISVLNADEEIDGVLRTLADASHVVVAVKGWEPPTLEFKDLLARVRGFAANAAIIVLPISLDGRVDIQEREIWATALADIDDGRTYVVSGS